MKAHNKALVRTQTTLPLRSRASRGSSGMFKKLQNTHHLTANPLGVHLRSESLFTFTGVRTNPK